MASLLRTAALYLSSPPATSPTTLSPDSRRHFLPLSTRRLFSTHLSLKAAAPSLPKKNSRRPSGSVSVGAYGEATEAEKAEAKTEEGLGNEALIDNITEDGAVGEEDEKAPSVIMNSLQSYKEALLNNDEAAVAEIEAFLQSIEEQNKSLTNKVATLTAELTVERERILRISADFDNFRKRTERERLSLMTNVQGEVIESLLPVLDNFERAKTQIKVETEGEEKINSSYQSIYKQFIEILISLGVQDVETVGKPFDPMLHEAIMREESVEYEEGVIIQEFRKGFILGERLLRPAMVKVSAGPGPGPEKTEDEDVPAGEDSALDPTAVTSEEAIEESDDGGADGGADSE